MILFTGAVVLLFYGMMFFRSIQLRQELLDDFSERSVQMADGLHAQFLERKMDNQILAKNRLVRSAFMNGNLSKVREELSEFVNQYRVYQLAVVSDDSGNILASSRGIAEKTRRSAMLSVSALQKKYVAGSAQIQDLSQQEATDLKLIPGLIQAYTSAVIDSSGKRLGWVTNFTNELLIDREVEAMKKRIASKKEPELRIQIIGSKNGSYGNVGEFLLWDRIDHHPRIMEIGENLFATFQPDFQAEGFPNWKINLAVDKWNFTKIVTFLRWGIGVVTAFLFLMIFYFLNFFQNYQIRMQRSTSRKLIEALELERASIARELHDGIGQSLVAAKMLVSNVSHSLGERQKNHINDLKVLQDFLIEETRSLSLALHPAVLDNLGFRSALEWKVKELNEIQSVKIHLEFISDCNDVQKFPKSTQGHLFRMIQEAINNALKHAKASAIQIVVKQESGKLFIEVSDNGIGFNTKSTARTLGITSMRERAAMCEGNMKFERLSKGTRVEFSVPISMHG